MYMYNDVDVYIHVHVPVAIIHVHEHVYELVSVQNQLDGCLTLCPLPGAHEKTVIGRSLGLQPSRAPGTISIYII